MRFIISVAIVIAGLSARVAVAQSIESLSPEQNVRVWARKLGSEGARATVVRAGPDSLTVRVGRSGTLVTIPNDSVWRLEIREGNHRGRGAFIGGVGGLVLGGVGGYLLSRGASAVTPDCGDCRYGPLPEERDRWAQEDRDLARQVGMVGAALGVVGGGLWGSRRLAPRWRRVSLPGRVGVTPHPHHPSRALAVTVGWSF